MNEKHEFSPEASGMDQERFDEQIKNEVEELRTLKDTDPEQYSVDLESLGGMLSGQGEGVSKANIEVKVEITKHLKEFASATPSEQAKLKEQIFNLASEYSHRGIGGLDREKIAVLQEFFKPEDKE